MHRILDRTDLKGNEKRRDRNPITTRQITNAFQVQSPRLQSRRIELSQQQLVLVAKGEPGIHEK
jgi:hypothetical protein